MATQRYLNSQPGASKEEFTERKFIRDMEDAGVVALGPLDERLEEIYVKIPVNDGTQWESTCKVIRPRSLPTKKRVMIVMFHGGSFIRGSPEMFTRPGREFALEFDAVVISVEYRLAPEYPWPTGVLDAWNVCQYLAERATTSTAVEIFGQDVDIDTSGFIIAGASAGANIASAVLSMSLLNSENQESADLRFKRQPLHVPITGIYLGVPFLLTDEIVPLDLQHLYISRRMDPVEAENINAVVRMYKADVRSPFFSPLNLPENILKLWPKTYVQVGDLDVWRDDGIMTEMALKKYDVETKLDRYPELSHMTWSVYTVGEELGIDSELGRGAMIAMQWLLGRG